MWANTKKTNGFTIVELLIVIVVIGILAAITTVAFNGVQNRTRDTVVQSDIKQYASKVAEFHALNGRYPVGTNNTTPVEGIASFKLSQSSYSTDFHNFYYCTGLVGGVEKYAIAAVSRSGNMFAYYSDTGMKPYTGAWANSGTSCPGLGISSYTYGYGHNLTSGWNSWTQ